MRKFKLVFKIQNAIVLFADILPSVVFPSPADPATRCRADTTEAEKAELFGVGFVHGRPSGRRKHKHYRMVVE